MKKIIIFISLILCAYSLTFADFKWQPTSIFASYIYSIGNDGANIYAYAYNRGLMMSSDKGLSWESRNNGLDDAIIYKIHYDNGALYAATSSGFYFSANKGATWNIFGYSQNTIRDFIIDGSKYFLLAYSNMYVSTNTGLSWKSSSLGQFSYITSIAYDKVDTQNSILYASNSKSISASYDFGTSWFTLDIALDTVSYINSIFLKKHKVFATTANTGVIASTDSGTTWNYCNNGLDSATLKHSIDFLYDDGTNLYIKIETVGIYYSSDNGENWVLKDNKAEAKTFNSMTSIGNDFYCGTSSNGVYYSSNKGTNWVTRNSNELNSARISLVKSNGNKTYAYEPSNGLYETTDYGLSWYALGYDLTYNEIKALIFKDSYIFIGFHEVSYYPEFGVYRSSDNGKTWVSKNTGLDTQSVYCLAQNGSMIYAGTYQGVYASSNNGDSWYRLTDSLKYPYVYSIFVNDNYIFAASNKTGLICSTDKGKNWFDSDSGLTTTNIVDIVSNGTSIFAATSSSGVFVSTNNGKIWKEANTGLLYKYLTSICVKDSILFIGTNSPDIVNPNNGVTSYSQGVLFSTNNGKRWRPINNGLNSLTIDAININQNYIYAGTVDAGLYYSSFSDLSNVTYKPRISALNSVIMYCDSTYNVNFLVDGNDPSSLKFILSSSNTDVIQVDSLKISGDSLSKILTIKPNHDSLGISIITIKVTDGKDTASAYFSVYVKESPYTLKPSITQIQSFYIDPNTSITFSLVLSTIKTDIDSVKLVITSSNTTLFPLDSIKITGDSTNRVLRLAPKAKSSGSSDITISFKDGKYTAITSFDASVSDYTKPKIDTIEDVVMLVNTYQALQFEVDGTHLDKLILFAKSSNTALLPLDSIVFLGDAFDRYIKFTPTLDDTGSCDVTVYLTDGTDTVSTTFHIIVVEDLSVDDFNASGNNLITLYPNPVNDKLYLINNLKNQNIEGIEIRDIKGCLIQNVNQEQLSYNNNTIEIDLSNAPPNSYFCVIKTKKSIIYKKFILEK